MPVVKRVLILTADAGLGHRSAANALRDALLDRHGPRVSVVVENPLDDPRTPGWLRDSQSNYDRIARNAPELYRAGYDFSDGKTLSRVMENVLRTLLYRSLRGCVERVKPDVIVSTYPMYQSPLGAVFALRKSFVPLITVVTDLASVHRLWFSEDSDLTVVATEMVRDLALDAGLPPEGVEILGIPVNPIFARETRPRGRIRRELGWRTGLTTLLAVGSRRTGRLAELLHALNHSGHRLELVVVTGGDEELRRLLTSGAWHLPARVYGHVQNLPTMMAAADAILCKPGGLVVSEALAAGLPMLLADPIPGQEEGNAAYVVSGGAGQMAGDPVRALETVCHWMADGRHELKECARRAKGLGRPRAAYDVADRAYELAQRGPVARETTSPGGLPLLIELFRRFKVSLED